MGEPRKFAGRPVGVIADFDRACRSGGFDDHVCTFAVRSRLDGLLTLFRRRRMQIEYGIAEFSISF